MTKWQPTSVWDAGMIEKRRDYVESNGIIYHLAER
jgi:hypothetical protein